MAVKVYGDPLATSDDVLHVPAPDEGIVVVHENVPVESEKATVPPALDVMAFPARPLMLPWLVENVTVSPVTSLLEVGDTE